MKYIHIWLSKATTRVVIQFPYCDCDCCAMFKWLLRKSADGRWWRGFDRISFAIALTRAREGLGARNDPETVTSNKILQHSDPMQKNWAQKDTWSQSGGSPDLFFKDIVGSAVLLIFKWNLGSNWSLKATNHKMDGDLLIAKIKRRRCPLCPEQRPLFCFNYLISKSFQKFQIGSQPNKMMLRCWSQMSRIHNKNLVSL